MPVSGWAWRCGMPLCAPQFREPQHRAAGYGPPPACICVRFCLYPAARGWRGQAPRQPGQIRKEAAVTGPAWVVVQPLTHHEFSQKTLWNGFRWKPVAHHAFSHAICSAACRGTDMAPAFPKRCAMATNAMGLARASSLHHRRVLPVSPQSPRSLDACRLNHREPSFHQSALKEVSPAPRTWFTREYCFDPYT